MFDFLVIYCHLVKDLHWDEKYLLKRLAFSLKFITIFPSAEWSEY